MPTCSILHPEKYISDYYEIKPYYTLFQLLLSNSQYNCCKLCCQTVTACRLPPNKPENYKYNETMAFLCGWHHVQNADLDLHRNCIMDTRQHFTYKEQEPSGHLLTSCHVIDFLRVFLTLLTINFQSPVGDLCTTTVVQNH